MSTGMPKPEDDGDAGDGDDSDGNDVEATNCEGNTGDRLVDNCAAARAMTRNEEAEARD